MKQTTKNILMSLAFFLGLALLLIPLSALMAPKGNHEHQGMEEVRANGILGEPENTVDVVIIGDSETFCAFMPLKMWDDHGITSYVCGTNTQLVCQSEYYLRRVLEHQKPKIVILETDAFYTDSGYGKVMFSKLSWYFPIFRYHDRWKESPLLELGQRTQYAYREQNKGYVYYDIIAPADTSEYMEYTEEIAPVPFKNQILLRQIKRECDRSGVQLMFVSTPSTANWDYYRHNGTAQVAEALGVEYLDMNTLPDEIPIDWALDTRDNGDHMNYNGALKVSSWLGDRLFSTGLLTDHRTDPDYSHWSECSESFQIQISK